MKGVTVDVVQAGAQAAQGTVAVAADTAQKVITTGGDVADAAGSVAIQGATAATKVVDLLPKISSAMAAAAAVSKNQKGGAIVYGDASISSSVLLFSVGLLAVCGYVMYAFRKTMDESRNGRQDDSPPDPSAVRSTSKANR
jgi:hypothetical protein